MSTTVSDHLLPDHSNVVVFPPVIPATGMLLGVALEHLVPIATWLSPRVLQISRILGLALLSIGAIGFAWMVITMKRARTPIHNARTPTRLVETGPFRLTRNPMYLFGSIGYAGITLITHQPWSLALLPFVFVGQHYLVVLREEAYLERKFGEAYRQYKARVPRWL